ncbi:hypothetical protein QYE76_023322 [Lolium multiflorum]|uniref:Uncharacterized protein n=1 Tax=Lolium multiflorum TaxID=4521 RepID=A0AAD8RAA1_LOLMU|nr:hypothetical protein QYE76_023322 [Lolium multiflorum]
MLSLLPLLLMTCLLQMSFPLPGLFVSVVLQFVTLLVSMVSLSFPSRLLIGMPSVILNGSLPWLRRSLRLSALALGILFLPFWCSSHHVLIRKISSLKKKDSIPSTYRVTPYSAANALPKNHPNLVSLPPLPEGGEVEERAVISDDNQDAPSFANEPASRKSAGSDEKEDASEATASALSPPPAVSPKNKRKRNDAEDSGTSKVGEAVPSHQKAGYDPYLEALISSDDEEEVPTADVAARTKKLAEVNERANTLAQKLEQSEEARKKAESDAVEARQEADKAKADAAGVEDLRKRLHDAETSLSDHITAQSAREAAITKRIRTQNRRFVRPLKNLNLKIPTMILFLTPFHSLNFMGRKHVKAWMKPGRGCRLFPYFFPKKEEPPTFLGLAKCFNPPEDLGLKMRHENMKVAVESTVALVADASTDY